MGKRTSLASKFWGDLVQKVDGVPGGKRYLYKLKKFLLEAEITGKELIQLKEGPVYQRALEMVAADVEFISLNERLRLVDERRKLKQKDFWLSLLEETGLDVDSGLAFDPIRGRVVNNQSKRETVPDSHKGSLEGYKDLIVTALYSPLVASRMVRDPFINFPEIKEMARVIINGDFKPHLRKMIEEWVEDPAEARESKSVLVEENMPEWLVEIATKLGRRAKWS
jgi:hypothetical protein